MNHVLDSSRAALTGEKRTLRFVGAVVALLLVAAACGPNAVAPTASGGAPTGASASRPSPSTTAEPGPSTPSPLGWQRITVVENATDVLGDWRTLAASPVGYVAVASSPPAVWFSPDGVSWSETRLTVPEGTALSVEAAAGGQDGLLVGGTYSPCSRRAFERNPFYECRGRPVSWVSSDGRAWTASAGWEGQVGEPGRSGSIFNSMWAVPGEGWDAAQAFNLADESDDLDVVGPAIWHSADGLSWELRKAHPSDYVDECGTDPAVYDAARAAADATGRRVVAGEASCLGPHVWSSVDGRSWTPVPGIGAQWPIRVVLPATTDRPWRLLGWEENADGDAIGAVAWRSPDLIDWTMNRLPSDGTAGGLVLAGTRGATLDVAVGWGGGANLTWISTEGADWHLAQQPSPAIEAVASGPVGIIGLIGIWDDAGDGVRVTGFEVWKLASG